MAWAGLLKAKWVLVAFSILWVFGSLAISIIDAGILCGKDGNCRPLLDVTIGRILGSDSIIERDVDMIVKYQDTMESSYVRFLKDEIMQSLLFIIIMLFFAIKLALWVYRIGSSQANENWFLMALVIFITLLLFLLATMVYKGAVNGEWSLNPLSGTTKLILNFPEVFGTIGEYLDGPSFMQINQSLHNMTNSTL